MKSPAPLIELTTCSLLLEDRPILTDIDFALRTGERWALIGPNGSGKTLLLKMLRGDVWPTPTGRERRSYGFDGRVSTEPAGSKQRIAYVGPERQDKYVRYGWNLTVEQVVTTGLFDEDIPLTQPSRAQRVKVERAIRRFGLWALRRRRVLTLSYGQRRLALVARAFVSDAQVLLLDEVFNGLDSRAKKKLQHALEQPRGGHEWILTSHRPYELPRNVTHIAFIAAGRIVRTGTGREARGLRSSSRAVRSDAVDMHRARALPVRTAKPASRGAGRPLVSVRNATLYRDYRAIVHDVNWTLRRGEHWAVMGANGSGKSTLLSLLYGDLHPALGGVIERQGVPAGTRIDAWKKRVGWVSPELQADHYLATDIEEIVISGRYASVGLNEPPTRADRRIAARWMHFFGIENLEHRGPRQVSYGQMRLALLARAMVNDPELLLLDEPCTGLDGDVREHVLAVLERLARNDTQIVMAVHDESDIIPAVEQVLRIERGGEVVIRRRANR